MNIEQNEGLATLLEITEVKEALASIEIAQLKRDSVSRKLSVGSKAVSVELLDYWERELETAKDRIRHPQLKELLAMNKEKAPSRLKPRKITLLDTPEVFSVDG